MIETLIGAGVTVVIAALGGLVWLIRLEGRINVEKAMREQIQERLNGFEERIYAKLDRIESKIDERITRDEFESGR